MEVFDIRRGNKARAVWPRFIAVCAALMGIMLPRAAHAQIGAGDIPAHHALNPMSVSRSSLFAQPWQPPTQGWTRTISVEYGSAIEWEESEEGGHYVLDAELLRAKLQFRKDLSTVRFVQVALDVNGVFNGFADGAFDWYHGFVGIPVRGREQRPRNEFLYKVEIPDGPEVLRERPDAFIGDLRLGYGFRHGASNQTTLFATIPTSTAPEGYSRKTYSVGAVHTLRVKLGDRVAMEGTMGAGYTPATGALSEYQEEFFNSTSLAMSVRVSQNTGFYGYLFTHSGIYRGTSLPELERRELTADFGVQRRTAAGRVWRLGFTEDFGPQDAGLDLILRFGWSW